eukprot:10381305-Lingulodinium_polyedra.AAC.1
MRTNGGRRNKSIRNARHARRRLPNRTNHGAHARAGNGNARHHAPTARASQQNADAARAKTSRACCET